MTECKHEYKEDEMLSKKIERMIKKKLSFTNGWYIEEERYDELVKELTKQIILMIEEE